MDKEGKYILAVSPNYNLRDTQDNYVPATTQTKTRTVRNRMETINLVAAYNVYARI